LPFWETGDSLNALNFIVSVAVEKDAHFAGSGAFAAGGFSGFKTTLTFNDLVLPQFAEAGNDRFPATLSARYESPTGMNVLLSWPVNVIPYPTAPGGGEAPLPRGEEGSYTREQVDAAIAASTVSYDSALRGLVGGTATDLYAGPTATPSCGHLLFVVLAEGICGYRLEETSSPTNVPWIIRGLDYNSRSNPRAWVRQS
jgi:hypothetical protein